MADPVPWGVYWTPVAMRARGGQQREHPVVVVQCPPLITTLATVQVVPLTTDYGGPKTSVRRITMERNPFLAHDSWALVHLVGPNDKKALTKLELAGQLHPVDVNQLKAALRFLFDLA